MQRVPPAAAGLGRQRRRRRARARRPVPAARLAARRGPLGDRAEDDARGHARPPRSQVCIGVPCNDPEAHGQHHLPGRPRGEDLHQAASRRLRDEVPRPAHRRGQAARGRALRRSRPARTARSGTACVGRQAARPRAPTSSRPQVRDTAGNVGRHAGRVRGRRGRAGRPGLTVRGLAAQPPLRPVTAGRAGRSSSSTRAARAYRWRVRRVGDSAVRKRGTATRARSSSFRAPEGPSGVYLLELRSGPLAHDACRSSSRPSKRSSVLVVVPAITWLGTDKVDDPPVRRHPEHARRRRHRALAARVRRRPTGLPAGFADDVAPLLVFLDRRRIRYDLTSDLDLDLTRNPRATRPRGRAARRLDALGHAPAGPAPAPLRDRRRPAGDRSAPTRCAAACGCACASPTTPARCSRATQPAADRPVRRADRPASARRRAGRRSASSRATTTYGLMEGALDLPGFTRLEESTSLRRAASCWRPSASR